MSHRVQVPPEDGLGGEYVLPENGRTGGQRTSDSDGPGPLGEEPVPVPAVPGPPFKRCLSMASSSLSIGWTPNGHHRAGRSEGPLGGPR